MRERYLRLTRENFRENGLSSGISPGISFQVAEHRFSGMGKTERGVYKAGANRARLTKHSLLSSNHTFPPQPFCHLRFRSHRLPLPSFTPAASLNSPLLTPFFYYAVPSNPLCIPLRLESDTDCCSILPALCARAFIIEASRRNIAFGTRIPPTKYIFNGYWNISYNSIWIVSFNYSFQTIHNPFYWTIRSKS